MKKTYLYALALCLALCGCYNSKSTSSNKTDNSENIINETSAFQSDNRLEESEISLLEHIKAIPSIVLCYEITDSKFLICTENNNKYSVYTIDTISGIKSEEIICDVIPQCENSGFWTLIANNNDGMTISSAMSEDKFCEAQIYDYNMNNVATIPLLNSINADGFDVDIDSKRVVYSLNEQTNDGNYVYRLNMTDYSFANHKTIYETALANSPILAGMDTLHICDNEIIFLGGYSSNTNSQSVRSYGKVPINTGNPKYTYRNDSYGYAVSVYENGAYIYECDYPYGVVSSGKCINIQNGTEYEISLENTMESLNISASKNGSYFTTAITGKNQNDSTLIRITVYGADGNIIKFFDIEYESGKNESIDSVYLFEENKTVYLKTLSAGGNENWYEFAF